MGTNRTPKVTSNTNAIERITTVERLMNAMAEVIHVEHHGWTGSNVAALAS